MMRMSHFCWRGVSLSWNSCITLALASLRGKEFAQNIFKGTGEKSQLTNSLFVRDNRSS